MEQLNVIHQVNELKKILSYASKIGFFFGAGTSCAFGLPNVAKLTTDIEATLSPPEQNRYSHEQNSKRVVIAMVSGHG